jgi:hypothetical protein
MDEILILDFHRAELEEEIKQTIQSMAQIASLNHTIAVPGAFLVNSVCLIPGNIKNTNSVV